MTQFNIRLDNEILKELMIKNSDAAVRKLIESEKNVHLGYEKYENSDKPNYRNGHKFKKVKSSLGELELSVPQDRDSSFQPRIIQKRK